MSPPRARIALRRNILIAACAVGVVVGIGLVARDAARTRAAEQQAKLAAVQQQRMPEGATEALRAYTSPAPAPRVDSTATKPVVIAVVKPWIEIASMPQYVQASSAERESIRDLYWRICVEERIPLAQRTSAYWQFVRHWEITESGASEDRTRTTSVSSYLREQQAVAPSPVNAMTMRRTCNSGPQSAQKTLARPAQ
jgi:hypothetical protein